MFLLPFVLITGQLKEIPTREKGFWKFNNSLTSNAEYVNMQKKRKIIFFETLHMLEQDKITNKHLRWGYLKYKIRKFTMNFLKNLIKKQKKDRNTLEEKN